MPPIPSLSIGQALRRFRPVPDGLDFVDGAAPLTRRSTLVVNSPHVIRAAAALSLTQRHLLTLPIQPTRARLLIGNRLLLANPNDAALTTPATINGVWVGKPVYNTVNNYRQWTGDFTAAPAQLWSGGVVPVDGSDLVSPWFAAADLPTTPGDPMLVSLGITTTNSGTGIGLDGSTQVAWCNGADRADDQTISSAPGYSAPYNQQALLDVRIEYEFVGTQRIGVVLGDSITAGSSGGDWTAQAAGTLSHQSWPGQAALRGGFSLINLGVPSAPLENFNSTTRRAISRVDLATTVPDFAIVALGTNNDAQIESNVPKFAAVIDTVRALGIKEIYVATLTPRLDLTPGKFGRLAASAAAGATSISSTISIPSGTTALIGSGSEAERVVTTGAPTGSGPYTIPVPALALAKAADRPVTIGIEMNRRQMNNFISQSPFGITGVIDFDAVIAEGTDSSVPDLRKMSRDLVHPLRWGYQVMAQLVVPIGHRP